MLSQLVQTPAFQTVLLGLTSANVCKLRETLPVYITKFLQANPKECLYSALVNLEGLLTIHKINTQLLPNKLIIPLAITV